MRERDARAESATLAPGCDDQDKRRLTLVFDHVLTVPDRSHGAIIAPFPHRG
jgi:hypothetical protein